MCNCNQKRATLSAGNSRKNRAEYDAHNGMNQVQLIQKNPLEINGDITGRKYVFKNTNDIVWVDKRDAMSMKKNKGLQIFF